MCKYDSFLYEIYDSVILKKSPFLKIKRLVNINGTCGSIIYTLVFKALLFYLLQLVNLEACTQAISQVVNCTQAVAARGGTSEVSSDSEKLHRMDLVMLTPVRYLQLSFWILNLV